MFAPELNEYPDSRKVWLGRSRQAEDVVDLLILPDQQPVDYLDGET